MKSRPVVLCILDGVGWGRRDDGDAVFLADTPHLDGLMETAPWCLLRAHGVAVGMPSDDDMGNSEVGHNAMGAGRIFDQGAKLVDNAIESGRIWTLDAWKRAIQGNTLHLIGLVSDGNVHSHVDHLHKMIRQASIEGVERLRVHVLTDGRDVPGRSALTYLEPLEALLADQPGDYAVGSGGGRMHITMDRYEADWSMVERGWTCHVHGQGERFESASEAVRTLYARDEQRDDQYLPAFIVGDYGGMDDGDAVLFFNFRGDRAVELCQAFDNAEFSGFDRGDAPQVFFAGMMQYDGDLSIPTTYLVEPPAIDDTVAQNLERANCRTLAISETQKFGHVTYFFNGNRGKQPPAEEWVEEPSIRVPFDQAPWMSAREVTEKVCSAIRIDRYDHIRVNLANGDMVGHTGDLDATVQAMECLDACLADLVVATTDVGGVLLVTADHGNADQMFEVDKHTGTYASDETGRRRPRTSHSLNPVPFIVYDPCKAWTLTAPTGPSVHGSIAQIGASVLALCGAEIPTSYLPSLVKTAGD